MPRDYKNRSQAVRPERPPATVVPTWMSLLVGLSCGLAIAIGAYVEGRYPGTILAADDVLLPAPEAEELVEPEPKPAARPQRKPRFEFYTLLPEMEVEVADAKPAPRRKPPVRAEAATQTKQRAANKPKSSANQQASTQPAAKPAVGAPVVDRTDASGFMLQVGSFSELADADRMRASLTLNGHDALIQTVSVNGIARHRVRLGPFDDRRALERAQADLASKRVSSMVLRIRG